MIRSVESGGWESIFVTNLVRARQRRGMSQTELAKRLSEAGLPFHQPMVARVEAGTRPVRVNEAQIITEVLFGGDWSRAIQPADASVLRSVVADLSTRLRSDLGGLQAQIQSDFARVDQLAMALIVELRRYRQAASEEDQESDAVVEEDVAATMIYWQELRARVEGLRPDGVAIDSDVLAELEPLRQQRGSSHGERPEAG